MSRILSPRAVASLTTENTDEVWLVLLEIEHPSISPPIRVVNDNVDCTHLGELYLGLPFSIELPDDTEDKPGEALVAIPNVDTRIVRAAREIVGPAMCSITVVLASQPDTIEVTYPGMAMNDLQWDAGAVRGRLRFEALTSEPCTLIITPERFRGLF